MDKLDLEPSGIESSLVCSSRVSSQVMHAYPSVEDFPCLQGRVEPEQNVLYVLPQRDIAMGDRQGNCGMNEVLRIEPAG